MIVSNYGFIVFKTIVVRPACNGYTRRRAVVYMHHLYGDTSSLLCISRRMGRYCYTFLSARPNQSSADRMDMASISQQYGNADKESQDFFEKR